MREGARNRQKGRKRGSVLIEKELGINAFWDNYAIQIITNQMIN